MKSKNIFLAAFVAGAAASYFFSKKLKLNSKGVMESMEDEVKSLRKQVKELDKELHGLKKGEPAN